MPIYGAKRCSACGSLECGLTERKITSAKARADASASGAIPLTGIVRPSNTVWVVGADVEAEDHAQRGE